MRIPKGSDAILEAAHTVVVDGIVTVRELMAETGFPRNKIYYVVAQLRKSGIFPYRMVFVRPGVTDDAKEVWLPMPPLEDRAALVAWREQAVSYAVAGNAGSFLDRGRAKRAKKAEYNARGQDGRFREASGQ